jgi:hypothetical protein
VVGKDSVAVCEAWKAREMFVMSMYSLVSPARSRSSDPNVVPATLASNERFQMDLDAI